jgi:hypothetical protein
MKRLAALSAIPLLLASPSHAALNCTLRSGVTPQQERQGLCGFDPVRRSFRGTAAEQADCLTRQVLRGAEIGEPTLTPFLRDRLDTPTGISRERLAAYLQELGVDVMGLGGPLSGPVTAPYFLIHDTSTPNCSQRGIRAALCPRLGVLPAGRDGQQWADAVGFHGHPRPAPNRLAHVITNRIGQSVMEADLDDHLPSTKFEQCVDRDSKRRLFVAVENIQPRIGDPAVRPPGVKPNDVVAPVPGFTARQYERLALVYVVASVRRGRWMIPAFHAVVDTMYASGHDDPQNFEMQAFSDAVRRHVERLTG